MDFNNNDAKLLHLNPNDIQNPPWDNPRSAISQADYEARKESIRKKGIHTPLHVRKTATGFEIVAGWTRRDIARELLLPTVPCLVREMTDKEAFELSVSENVDRTQMSILDEAKGFRQIVAAHSGDVQAASSEMGWSKDKLNRALQLLRSSVKVQDLIGRKQENGFILSVAHAARLSVLPEELQDKIVDSVISNKMTVAVLKEKIDRGAKRDLKTANFCTRDCEKCQYNTRIQTSLFEEENSSNCTNPTCFQKKTDEHFEERVKELEEEYGKVVLLSTIATPLEINTQMVGSDQYTNGCLSCKNYCAVLADTGLKQGTIMKSQCLDSACAAKHQKAEAKRIAQVNAPTSEPTTATSSVTAKNTSNNSQPSTTETKGTAQKQALPPKRLIMESQTSLRTTAINALVEHQSYHLAVTYSALKVQTSSERFEETLIKAMNMEPQELEQAMMQEINTLTTVTQKDSLNMERTLIRAADKHIGDFKKRAIADWTPTKDRLTDMTNAIRQQALEQSGFADAYKNAHSEKEYQQLLNQKTADQVKAILAFKFDGWANYAPDYYITATKTQKYNF